MTNEKTLDDYIKPNQIPNARRFNDLFATAVEEMLIPAPSVTIPEFPKFDKTIGGFRAREFTILCGSTGSGKTSLLACLSASFIGRQIPHFVASVETGPTDFVKRVVSCLADEDVNTGDAVPLAKVQSITSRFSDMLGPKVPAYISLYDNRFPVEDLISDLAFLVKHRGVKVAMIDNLNFFMEVTNAANAIQEMDRVVHELVIFCKRVDVHLIMVMHPRKGDDKNNNRVLSEYDVKGSATSVQESHNVLLWNRMPAEDKNNPSYFYDPSLRELKIAKMRRRGKAIGKCILFRSTNGVRYFEHE